MLPKPAEGPCALCCSATPCAFQVKDQASADWAVVCRHSRNKVVAVCDFYMYMRHICQVSCCAVWMSQLTTSITTTTTSQHTHTHIPQTHRVLSRRRPTMCFGEYAILG